MPPDTCDSRAVATRNSSRVIRRSRLSGQKYRLCLAFFILPFLTAGATASASIDCEDSGRASVYRANVQDGYYLYIEERPGAPMTDAAFERWTTDGKLMWRANSQRACSQGVSRCYLFLPYALDGEPFGDIETKVNDFKIDGDRYVIFSHLRARIIQRYFKDHPFRRFSLIGTTRYSSEPRNAAGFEIPALFKNICAPRKVDR